MNRIASFLLFLVIALLTVIPAAAQQANGLTIQEWTVPWENTRPRDPYVAPDGKVWFVGQRGHYAAAFDPETEQFTRIDMDDGTGPHNLIVDDAGIVWYAGNRAAHIGRIDPDAREGERIRKYPTPESNAADPHTLIQADNGTIWFTSQQSNGIGRFNPESGEVEMLDVPTPRARPYGIDLDSKGHPWVVLLGTNKLVHIDPDAFSLKEIDLPRAAARPRRMGITSDDLVWYVDYAEGYLGHYDPASGEFKEWQTPGRQADGIRGSGPYGMAVDGKDRLWFVETFQDPNRFVGFDPATESFFSAADVPSGGGTIRHMYYDSNTDSVWFGTDTNNLGQAKLPE